MQLTEAFAKLQGLEIFEKRSVTDEVVDVVFENIHAAAWHERMASILGPALKPAGEKAGSQANKLAKAFGGIRPEQALYYMSFGDHAVMAVFWPWQNGKCTTCKMFPAPTIEPEKDASIFNRWFKK